MDTFSEEVKMEIYFRDKKQCGLDGCYGKQMLAAHHCFPKSLYFEEDRNEAWNGILICGLCHFAIHHQGAISKKYECMNKALSRYNGKYRDELLQVIRGSAPQSESEAGF